MKKEILMKKLELENKNTNEIIKYNIWSIVSYN